MSDLGISHCYPAYCVAGEYTCPRHTTEKDEPMWYAVVLEGMPTLYVYAGSDESALRQARELERVTGRACRLVFVSAHNDPENGPSRMREVFRA